MTAPTLTGVRAAVITHLATTGVTVYEHVTPADVDITRPWIVAHWPPGGRRDGPAVDPSGLWSIALRVTAVAQSPTGTAEIPSAVYHAAQWAADKTRQVVLDVTRPIVDSAGYRVVARELQAQGGILTDGPTVNIPDDYLLTVRRD